MVSPDGRLTLYGGLLVAVSPWNYTSERLELMDDIGNEKPHLRESLAGDLKQGWDDTSRLDSRLESFSVLKHSTHEFVQWARDGGIPLFDKPTTLIFNRLDDCAKYFIFHNYEVSKKSRLIGGCSCKQHLLCAFCASRRGVR